MSAIDRPRESKRLELTAAECLHKLADSTVHYCVSKCLTFRAAIEEGVSGPFEFELFSNVNLDEALFLSNSVL
jgi:hypothetical protein